MRITLSGTPGSGKTSVAKSLSRRLKLKHYSIGDLMRKIAKEKNMTLIQLTRLANKSDEIDKELDKAQIDLKKEDNFVIDSRIGFYFIPNSVKIFLDADFDIRIKRIFGGKRVEETYSDLSQAKKEIKERFDSEQERYRKLYDLDYLDKKNYDYILDTSKLKVEEATDKIIKFIKKDKFLK